MFAGSAMTQAFPQGSTKCEHQRIKDRPLSTRALPTSSPSFPLIEGPPPECPQGLASVGRAAETQPVCLIATPHTHPARPPQKG